MSGKNHDIKCLVQYGDVLKNEVNRNLFRYIIAREKLFINSGVVNKRGYKAFKDWRKSKIIYDWDLKNEFVPYFNSFIKKNFNQVCKCLQIKPFEIDDIDMQVTSHNDGEHFNQHSDKGTEETNNRMITFVYYFHSPVKRFSGGELLFPENGRIIVEPVNNSIIFFNPVHEHEVLPVVCPGKKFKDGRFTINGWLLKKLPAKKRVKNLKKSDILNRTFLRIHQRPNT